MWHVTPKLVLSRASVDFGGYDLGIWWFLGEGVVLGRVCLLHVRAGQWCV
jgi:hypothetical protein